MTTEQLSDDLKTDLVEAARLTRSWHPAPLADTTSASYQATVARIEAGHDFSAARSPRYMHTVRAAWRRHVLDNLAEVVREMAGNPAAASARLDEMRRWLSEARSLRWPMQVPPDAPRAHRKRDGIRALPRTWLSDLWSLANARRDGRPTRNLDALAVLICSGARPAEIEAGVLVEVAGQAVHMTVRGAKVRSGVSGQPWRKLSVASDDGPAAHLAMLAANGSVTVSCLSGHAVSQVVSDLAGERWGRRVSACDIRHQRAADARIAFRDPECVAGWMGHVSSRTMRHYTRLPVGGGVAGPIPIDVSAPTPIRRPAPRASSVKMNNAEQLNDGV